jgi:hypothetical protein
MTPREEIRKKCKKGLLILSVPVAIIIFLGIVQAGNGLAFSLGLLGMIVFGAGVMYLDLVVCCPKCAHPFGSALFAIAFPSSSLSPVRHCPNCALPLDKKWHREGANNSLKRTDQSLRD